MERTERLTFHTLRFIRIRTFTSKKVVKNNFKGARKKLKRKLYAKASEKAHGKKLIIWNKGKAIGLNPTIEKPKGDYWLRSHLRLNYSLSSVKTMVTIVRYFGKLTSSLFVLEIYASMIQNN